MELALRAAAKRVGLLRLPHFLNGLCMRVWRALQSRLYRITHRPDQSEAAANRIRSLSASTHNFAEELASIVVQAQAAPISEDIVAALREYLGASATTVSAARVAIDQLVPTGTPTSRAGYLRSLGELLPGDAERSWQDEWPALIEEYRQMHGRLEAGTETVAACTRQYGKSIGKRVREGWSEDAAVAYSLLSAQRAVLAASLRDELPRRARFRASVFALSSAMCEEVERQVVANVRVPLAFRNLVGKGGLEQDDPRWRQLETPDASGFCGLTCTAMVRGVINPLQFSDAGLSVFTGGYTADGRQEYEERLVEPWLLPSSSLTVSPPPPPPL